MKYKQKTWTKWARYYPSTIKYVDYILSIKYQKYKFTTLFCMTTKNTFMNTQR